MEGGYMSEQEYEKILCEMKEELVGMKDLFVRRLYEDKQKTELIRILTEQIHFTVLEPFISDLILVLDRLESSEDEFSCSVHDEILHSYISGTGAFVWLVWCILSWQI